VVPLLPPPDAPGGVARHVLPLSVELRPLDPRMTGTYTVTVTYATTQLDAEDIAKRRALADGYRCLLVLRSHRIGLPTSTAWSVEMVVEKRA
jgi:hypothetical protein